MIKNKKLTVFIFMMMSLVNYSWGQRWSGGTHDLPTSHGAVYTYISGTSPLGKFAKSAMVILPNGTTLSLAAGELFPIGLAGQYVVGGANYAFSFFMQEVTDWDISGIASVPGTASLDVEQGQTVILTPTGTVATAVFVNTVIEAVESSSIKIHLLNGTLTVTSENPIKKVEVYDFSGQLLRSVSANSTKVTIGGFSQQMLIVKVVLNNGEQVVKKEIPL